MHHRLKNWKKAEEAYKRALEHDPGFIEA